MWCVVRYWIICNLWCEAILFSDSTILCGTMSNVMKYLQPTHYVSSFTSIQQIGFRFKAKWKMYSKYVFDFTAYARCSMVYMVFVAYERDDWHSRIFINSSGLCIPFNAALFIRRQRLNERCHSIEKKKFFSHTQPLHNSMENWKDEFCNLKYVYTIEMHSICTSIDGRRWWTLCDVLEMLFDQSPCSRRCHKRCYEE